MMTDKELLELAAKAAGMEYPHMIKPGGRVWNPLTDDGDALRLAVTLHLSMDLFDNEILVGYTPDNNDCEQVVEPVGDDPYAATRRAIVRAAAEIWKGMP
jgi:hypothetical protein